MQQEAHARKPTADLQKDLFVQKTFRFPTDHKEKLPVRTYRVPSHVTSRVRRILVTLSRTYSHCMETYTLPTPAYPAELGEITLALWTNIASASELRQRLVAASMMQGTEAAAVREKLDFAFIDGTMVCPSQPFNAVLELGTEMDCLYRPQIVSRQHILTAAHQAILGAAQGELRTQTVHSELIDHLNPTTNVSSPYCISIPQTPHRVQGLIQAARLPRAYADLEYPPNPHLSCLSRSVGFALTAKSIS